MVSRRVWLKYLKIQRKFSMNYATICEDISAKPAVLQSTIHRFSLSSIRARGVGGLSRQVASRSQTWTKRFAGRDIP
jgi:hypothetical protein